MAYRIDRPAYILAYDFAFLAYRAEPRRLGEVDTDAATATLKPDYKESS